VLGSNDCRNILEANLNGLCRSFYAFTATSTQKREEQRQTAQAYIYFAHAICLIDYQEFVGLRDWIQNWGTEDLAKYVSLNVLHRLAREAADG